MMTTRIKVWLKTYGYLKEDGWWRMPTQGATSRFVQSLEWELEKELWFRNKDKSIMVLLDWDGDITSLAPDRIASEMDIIGQCMGLAGWAPLKRLSTSEDFFLLYKLPTYQEMISH